METIPHYWVIPDIKKEKHISMSVKRQHATRAIERVCETMDVTWPELIGKSRERRISEPRNVLFYILHKVYKLSSTETGKMLNRNHATVLNGSNRVEGFITYDKNFKNQIEEIIN